MTLLFNLWALMLQYVNLKWWKVIKKRLLMSAAKFTLSFSSLCKECCTRHKKAVAPLWSFCHAWTCITLYFIHKLLFILTHTILILNFIHRLPSKLRFSTKKVCLTRLLSLEKQKVAIADSTETINIVIWQDHIEQLNLGHSYEFLNITVRMFDMVKSLTTSRKLHRNSISACPSINYLWRRNICNMYIMLTNNAKQYLFQN